MLSIGVIAAGNQGRYYTQLGRSEGDGYYVHSLEPPGRWYGAGAAQLGLAGHVTAAVFAHVLAGFSPAGDVPLVRNAGRTAGARAHRPGLDLTFSAPKSVSVLWAVARPDTRAVFEAAHDEAVEAALDYLQDRAMHVRRGQGGCEQEPAAMTCAIFQHGTSRAGDPDLHSHAVCVNVGVRADGTTGALVHPEIFKHKMAAGVIYRAELAAQLERQLGLVTEKDGRSFAVAGVPKALCAAFSQRRAQIQAALNEAGLWNARAAALAARETRGAKAHVPRAELFADWQRQAAERGFTAAHVRALPGRLWPRSEPVQAERAVDAALQRLLQERAVFSERDLTRAAAEESQTLGGGAQAVRAAVAQRLFGPEPGERAPKRTPAHEAVALGEARGQGQFTTREMLALEREVVTAAMAGRTDERHRVSAQIVEAVLDGKPSLAGEQRAATRHITEEAGTVKVVSGMAGTGKTYMVGAAREIWERQGLRVLGAAVSGRAAQGLQEDAGISSHTLARLFWDWDSASGPKPGLKRRLLAEFKHATWQIDGVTRRKMLGEYHKPTSRLGHEWKYVTWRISRPHRDFLNGQLERQQRQLDARTVLVVDEASMVGTRDMARLLRAVKAAGAKLVLVGDERQLQSIEAGGAFAALGEKLGRAELKDITRQNEAWEREAIKDFAAGEAGRALRAYAEHDRVTLGATREAATQDLFARWKEHGVARPEEHVIMAATNHEVARLNRMAQQERLERGEIGGAGLHHASGDFHVGDRVMFTRNLRVLGITNGSAGVVKALDVRRKTLTVQKDGRGARVTVDLKAYGDVRLAYCWTAHKLQGATVENAYVLAGGAMTDREMTYVQASRARGETHFFLSADEAGPDLTDVIGRMAQSRRKEMAVQAEERSQEPARPQTPGRNQTAGRHQQSGREAHGRESHGMER